jgi:hypothetical protein
MSSSNPGIVILYRPTSIETPSMARAVTAVVMGRVMAGTVQRRLYSAAIGKVPVGRKAVPKGIRVLVSQCVRVMVPGTIRVVSGVTGRIMFGTICRCAVGQYAGTGSSVGGRNRLFITSNQQSGDREKDQNRPEGSVRNVRHGWLKRFWDSSTPRQGVE